MTRHDQLIVIQLCAGLSHLLQQLRAFDLEAAFYAGSL
jgi:hypothetical protein